MARGPKTSAAAEKPSANALVPWDEELAKHAEAAAAAEANSGGGQFFSVRGGQLSFNDAPVPGNQMGVVILASIFENVYYEGVYDPNNPTPPTCFAFSPTEDTLAPHEAVVAKGQQQHDDACKGCPMNEWASAETGRGKACRNTRRLGLIPAGEFNKDNRFEAYDADHFTSAGVGYLKLPVTSVKGYANFVKQVANTLRRPPFAIFTKVRIVPDPQTQFKVLFEPLGAITHDLMPVIMDRHNEVEAAIAFPYNLDVESPLPQPAARGRGAPARAPKAPPPATKGRTAAAGKRY